MSFHVHVAVTETTTSKPLVDRYNRTVQDAPAPTRETVELVRINITKDTQEDAIDAAVLLLTTLRGQ